MSAEPLTYEPWAGDHISRTCEDAACIAALHQKPVAFRFNDVDVLVQPGELPSAVAERWQADMDRQVEEYRRSPAGIAAAAEADRRRREEEARTSATMASIPNRIQTLEGALDVCVELSRDAAGPDWNPSAVAEALTAAGYLRHAHVGTAVKALRADPQMMGEYIVGQAIDGLLHGMPPHPMTEIFAQERKRLMTTAAGA